MKTSIRTLLLCDSISMRSTISDACGPGTGANVLPPENPPHGTYTEYATDLEPADGPAGPGYSYVLDCGPSRRFVPELLLVDKQLDGCCGAKPRYLLTIARNPPHPEPVW